MISRSGNWFDAELGFDDSVYVALLGIDEVDLLLSNGADAGNAAVT